MLGGYSAIPPKPFRRDAVPEETRLWLGKFHGLPGVLCYTRPDPRLANRSSFLHSYGFAVCNAIAQKNRAVFCGRPEAVFCTLGLWACCVQCPLTEDQ